MIHEGERKYKLNPFAKYLAGFLYERSGEFDSAYIDYKAAYDLRPDFRGLHLDLIRMARKLRRWNDLDRWKKQFQLTPSEQKRVFLPLEKASAEVLVIFQNGISPRKTSHENFYSIPRFIARYNPVEVAKIRVDGGKVEYTHPLFDVEATAIQNLEDNYAGLIAKKLAGIVAKEVVSSGVEKATDSPLLGGIARLFFYASDRADIRSWSLLPKDFQVYRMALSAGPHVIEISLEGIENYSKRLELSLKPGEKKIVNFRYVPR